MYEPLLGQTPDVIDTAGGRLVRTVYRCLDCQGLFLNDPSALQVSLRHKRLSAGADSVWLSLLQAELARIPVRYCPYCSYQRFGGVLTTQEFRHCQTQAILGFGMHYLSGRQERFRETIAVVSYAPDLDTQYWQELPVMDLAAYRQTADRLQQVNLTQLAGWHPYLPHELNWIERNYPPHNALDLWHGGSARQGQESYGLAVACLQVTNPLDPDSIAQELQLMGRRMLGLLPTVR